MRVPLSPAFLLLGGALVLGGGRGLASGTECSAAGFAVKVRQEPSNVSYGRSA